ncbi:hypothetical protein Glove_150g62 [Diversispora epigaea]|uniref:Trafficking protein particle complex subunit 13 n=1 Tax=Diversispora epigaea TaxID=1348612 RepID=A0A397IW24_9GLOM|nr:hypothetical protein Glove_150g62 [Diversispora epigaea]
MSSNINMRLSTINMDLPHEQHYLSLKVMRLSNPIQTKTTTSTFNSSSADFIIDPLAGQKPPTKISMKDISESELLIGGGIFTSSNINKDKDTDNIYLGATFDSYITITNESKYHVHDIGIKVELQTASQRLILLDKSSSSTTSSLSSPNITTSPSITSSITSSMTSSITSSMTSSMTSNITSSMTSTTITTPSTDSIADSIITPMEPSKTQEFIIRHEIKELGIHNLVCTLQYVAANEGMKRLFRKYYRFQVFNPFAVKTKANNMGDGTVFLEVQIQNVSERYMYLERMNFEPGEIFNYQDLNYVVKDKIEDEDEDDGDVGNNVGDDVDDNVDDSVGDNVGDNNGDVDDVKGNNENDNNTDDGSENDEFGEFMSGGNIDNEDNNIFNQNKQNENNKIGDNQEENKKENIRKNIVENIKENIVENITENMVENVKGDIKEDIVENVLENIEEEEEEEEKESIFGNNSYLNPQDIRQYLYMLKPKPEVNDRLGRTTNALGKLDIIWRSHLGETGRLQTSQLTRKSPTLDEIELSVISIPSIIQLEIPFKLGCRIRNRTTSTIKVIISAIKNKMGSTLLSGQSSEMLGELISDGIIEFELEFFPLSPGLQRVGGLKLTDIISGYTKEFDHLTDVFVVFL